LARVAWPFNCFCWVDWVVGVVCLNMSLVEPFMSVDSMWDWLSPTRVGSRLSAATVHVAAEMVDCLAGTF